MSSTLPVLSGQELVRIFERHGWTKARQKGSHIILTKPGSIASLSIPDHREVAKKWPEAPSAPSSATQA